jgi:hypothetical protein
MDHNVSCFWRYCAPATVLRTEEFSTTSSTASALVGAFAKLGETTATFVMSVRPHGTTLLPLDEYLQNLGVFLKYVEKLKFI